jgi:hypothetical protein
MEKADKKVAARGRPKASSDDRKPRSTTKSSDKKNPVAFNSMGRRSISKTGKQAKGFPTKEGKTQGKSKEPLSRSHSKSKSKATQTKAKGKATQTKAKDSKASKYNHITNSNREGRQEGVPRCTANEAHCSLYLLLH